MATKSSKPTKKMAPKGPMKMKEDMVPTYKKGGSMGKKKC